MFEMKDVNKAMVSAYRLGVSEEDFSYLTGYSIKKVRELYKHYEENPDLVGDLNIDKIADLLRTFKTLLACYDAGFISNSVQQYVSLRPYEVENVWKTFKWSDIEKSRKRHISMNLNPLLVLASYGVIDIDITSFCSDIIKMDSGITVSLWDLLDFYEEGLSYLNIANRLGCQERYVSVVCQIFKRLGLKQERLDNKYYQRSYRVISNMTGVTIDEAESLFDDIKDMYIQGMQSNKVAEILGVSIDTVLFCFKMCIRLGFLEHKKEKNALDDSDIKFIKESYEKGFSATEVSSQINKPIAKVNKEFCRLKETESYQIREKYILDSNLKVYELFIKGFKKSEIASILDISVNQVTNKLSWVRKNVSVDVLTEMSKHKEKRHKNKNGEI